jgi:1-acyl-sn-glycerol-3-phosphate acyltransferase
MDAKADQIPSIFILYIRSVIFWLGFSLSTFVVSLFVILSFFLNSDIRLKVSKIWAVISIWLLKVICKVDYIVEGRENIGDKNAIVFCKHQSTWETIFLHILIPLGRWVYKRELMFLPFFGWALACTDPIALNRGSGHKAIKQLVNQGTEKLQRGKWINFFPEGTRRAPDAEPRYKLGGAILAAESGYPVLPIAHNAGEYWPKHSFIKWPGTIKVCVGPLIETKGKKADEIMKEAQDWIEGKMKEISDPSQWNR